MGALRPRARVGQKGRGTRVWFERGVRPVGVIDRRYASAWIYAAVRPGTDAAFAPVPTETSAAAMALLLQRFGESLAKGVHVAPPLDGAGWHTAKDIAVPDDISLVLLPPYSPDLNPVERVWLHLRERFLSHRLLNSNAAIVDACCQAWNTLTPDRLRSLTSYPWIRKITS